MASHVVWLVSRECPRRYSFTTTTTTTHGSACPQVKVNICCFTGRSNIFVGIQLYNSQSIFETACELFLKKYFCTHSQYSNIKKVSNCIYIN